MNSLAEAKVSASRLEIAAELEFSEALAAHRTIHSAAVADLVNGALPDDAPTAQVWAWLQERTGPSKARVNVAADELRVATVRRVAAEDASHAENQAARAKAASVQYADKLKAATDTAEAAFLLASKAIFILKPETKRIRIR